VVPEGVYLRRIGSRGFDTILQEFLAWFDGE